MSDAGELDVFLLRVFEALYAERSVTAAGRRLGRSQPAVSSALARLRAALDDELFVRVGNSMQPTPAAERMVVGVGEALAAVRGLKRVARFDPSTADDEIRIGTSDYGTALLVPALAARLREQAPRLRLRVSQTTKRRDLLRLEEGTVDLLLGVHPSAPSTFRRVALLRESFLVLGSVEALTLEEYVRRPHVLVSLADDAVGSIDSHLAELGHARQVTVTVPHFLGAAWLAASSAALVTMPARLARRLAECHGLRCFAPPIELPSFVVEALWTDRTHTDPLHAWLRRELREAASQID